jgi:hypothetical protein
VKDKANKQDEMHGHPVEQGILRITACINAGWRRLTKGGGPCSSKIMGEWGA